jgi:hypothetical protein
MSNPNESETEHPPEAQIRGTIEHQARLLLLFCVSVLCFLVFSCLASPIPGSRQCHVTKNGVSRRLVVCAGPFLVDVVVSDNHVYPMIPAGKVCAEWF